MHRKLRMSRWLLSSFPTEKGVDTVFFDVVTPDLKWRSPMQPACAVKQSFLRLVYFVREQKSQRTMNNFRIARPELPELHIPLHDYLIYAATGAILQKMWCRRGSDSLTLSIRSLSHSAHSPTPSLSHSLTFSLSRQNPTWSWQSVDLLCKDSTPSSAQPDTCHKTPLDIWFNIALLSLPTPSLYPLLHHHQFFFSWMFPSSLRFFWSLQFSTGSH